MLKKSITYEDFDGNTVTEEHYFHLSKAELVEMEMSHKGGLHEHLQKIVESEDGAAIIAEFKQLILAAYGQRSHDGKRFVKTQELRDEFVSSEAYSALFMELCTNAEAAAEFVNGIVPSGLEKELAQVTGTSIPEPVAAPRSETTVLTPAEFADMDSDELKSGLATGRYKLAEAQPKLSA